MGNLFSIQKDNELYYKDIFIGYILIKSQKFVEVLNYEEFNDNIDWEIDENYISVGDKKILKIHNTNFNDLIIKILNNIPNYDKEYRYYLIECRIQEYVDYYNFLTSKYKVAVQQLVELNRNSDLRLLYGANFNIKPILL